MQINELEPITKVVPNLVDGWCSHDGGR